MCLEEPVVVVVVGVVVVVVHTVTCLVVYWRGRLMDGN